jgi:signal transduction histidine kinase
LKPLGEGASLRFYWEAVAEDDRRTQQDAVDEALNRETEERSIQVAVRLLGASRFWGSSTERKQNWLFVRFGELILCCYEHELLKAFSACSVSDDIAMGNLEHSLGKRFAACCHAAWAVIVETHGHGETAEGLCAIARQWLRAILNRPEEYGDWDSRLIAPLSLDDAGICAGVSLSADEFAVTWARAVCRGYPTCTIEETRRRLAQHWRFCPEAEGSYGTRNLVVFRLWTHGEDSPQERGSANVALDRTDTPPFAAYFIATFYSDEIIERYASQIQALLSNIAQRDIVAFATRSYAAFVRADVSSRSFQHAVKSRCGVLGNAIANLRKLVGADHPKEMESIENAITFLRRGSQLSRSLLKEWEVHRPVRVDVSEIIKNIVTILGDRRVRLVVPALPAIVMGEIRKLEQAVVEIVANALDFVNAEMGIITITVVTSTDRVEVHVQDNGSGIHPSLRGRLFSEYSCYPADRLGLGLAYARRVVEAHGGKLSEIGELGTGAHFVVALPAAKGT